MGRASLTRIGCWLQKVSAQILTVGLSSSFLRSHPPGPPDEGGPSNLHVLIFGGKEDYWQNRPGCLVSHGGESSSSWGGLPPLIRESSASSPLQKLRSAKRERSHTLYRVSVSSLVHRFSRRCKGLAYPGLSQSPTKSSSKTSSELPNQDKRLWVSTKLDAGWTGFPPYLVPRKNDKPPVPRSITWCRSPRPRAKVRTHPHSFSWPSSQ